jgi:cephalosporin hydroxylase
MALFDAEVNERIRANGTNAPLRESAAALMKASLSSRYSYNFSWLGRPIIQYPQDVMAIQELIWSIQPELIIETGIAHGGSLILSASMLELNAVCGGPTEAKVIGIDIDIRAHNRVAIETHPLARRIEMIEGSSIAPGVIAGVVAKAAGRRSVLVLLDSNHTRAHVLAELEAYAPLVSHGSYCVVFDTIVDEMPAEMFGDRPWGPGNNPKSAVREYLKSHPEFEIDTQMDHKLLVSVAPEGYLKRVTV